MCEKDPNFEIIIKEINNLEFNAIPSLQFNSKRIYNSVLEICKYMLKPKYEVEQLYKKIPIYYNSTENELETIAKNITNTLVKACIYNILWLKNSQNKDYAINALKNYNLFIRNKVKNNNDYLYNPTFINIIRLFDRVFEIKQNKIASGSTDKINERFFQLIEKYFDTERLLALSECLKLCVKYYGKRIQSDQHDYKNCLCAWGERFVKLLDALPDHIKYNTTEYCSPPYYYGLAARIFQKIGKTEDAKINLLKAVKIYEIVGNENVNNTDWFSAKDNYDNEVKSLKDLGDQKKYRGQLLSKKENADNNILSDSSAPCILINEHIEKDYFTKLLENKNFQEAISIFISLFDNNYQNTAKGNNNQFNDENIMPHIATIYSPNTAGRLVPLNNECYNQKKFDIILRDYVAKIDSLQKIILDQFRDEITVEKLAQYLKEFKSVPEEFLQTYAQGFYDFLTQDIRYAIYILTPLLENLMQFILKKAGMNTIKINSKTETIENLSISGLFEKDSDTRKILDEKLTPTVTEMLDFIFYKKENGLRHTIAHGLLSDKLPEDKEHLLVYGLYLMFKICFSPMLKKC